MSILDNSVQINDGFTETSADGAALAFDSKYGIMFCAYMPGCVRVSPMHCHEKDDIDKFLKITAEIVADIKK